MKAVPVRPRGSAASLWMHHRFALFSVALTLAGALPACATPARAAGARPLLAAVTVGVRSFDEDLDLESEAAFGARFGIGVNDRVSLWLDALTTSPSRRVSGETAQVTALRAIAQARILTGVVRPYALIGAGGMIFNFEDTVDAAGGILTFGGGVEWRLARRTFLFAEGTADIYRARTVTYSPTGEELSSSPRDTQSATTVAVGVAVGF